MVVKDPTRIALWAGPRVMATAFMYMFEQRVDTNVVDEPLHAYYLGFTGKETPTRRKVLDSMDKDPHAILNALTSCDLNKPLLFVKNLSNQVIGLQWDFLLDFKNFFLIDRPERLVASYLNHGIQPGGLELGYEIQLQMLLYLIEHGIQPIVVDAGEFVASPNKTLEQLMDLLNITVDDRMLNWEAGVGNADGPWADHWYSELKNAKSITDIGLPSAQIPSEYKILVEEMNPHYERLYKYALKAD